MSDTGVNPFVKILTKYVFVLINRPAAVIIIVVWLMFYSIEGQNRDEKVCNIERHSQRNWGPRFNRL